LVFRIFAPMVFELLYSRQLIAKTFSFQKSRRLVTVQRLMATIERLLLTNRRVGDSFWLGDSKLVCTLYWPSLPTSCQHHHNMNLFYVPLPIYAGTRLHLIYQLPTSTYYVVFIIPHTCFFAWFSLYLNIWNFVNQVDCKLWKRTVLFWHWGEPIHFCYLKLFVIFFSSFVITLSMASLYNNIILRHPWNIFDCLTWILYLSLPNCALHPKYYYL
jgi:hypothetical protein